MPHTVLERRTWCFSLYTNRKLKVKLWWVGARKKKWVHFLYRSFCPKEIFLTFLFDLNVLYSVFVYTFRTCILLHVKKNYLYTFCMFLKLLKAFGISLTLFRMGLFGAAQEWGGRGAFPNICHPFHTMMKLAQLYLT